MILRLGDHGEKVKLLQRALNRYGFSLNDDAYFGDSTDTAVRQFQEENGLDVDPLTGEDTLVALGLDPDTLEELSFGGDDDDVEVITFDSDEVNLDGFDPRYISAAR